MMLLERKKPICLLDYSSDIINSNVLQLTDTASLHSANLALLSFSCHVEFCPVQSYFPLKCHLYLIFEPILYHSQCFLLACLFSISQHCHSSAHTLTSTQLLAMLHIIDIRHNTKYLDKCVLSKEYLLYHTWDVIHITYNYI